MEKYYTGIDPILIYAAWVACACELLLGKIEKTYKNVLFPYNRILLKEGLDENDKKTSNPERRQESCNEPHEP